MTEEITYPLLLALCFLTLFGLAEFLYHKRKVKPENTRKIVHLGTGLLTLLFPILLTNHWQVLFLCGSFLLLLLASLHLKLLPSINGIDRVSHGSILFPVAVYGCYLAYNFAQQGLIFFYLPILILAISDPVAALVGKRHQLGRYHIGSARKTLIGSLAFFVSASMITTICIHFHQISFSLSNSIFPCIILVGITASAIEAISGNGTDNITIPAVVVLDLFLIL